MNIHRLLAGTLALVLIAGLGNSAFADEESGNVDIGQLIIPENLVQPLEADDDVIFDNGVTIPDIASCWINDGFDYSEFGWSPADDFVIEGDVLLTDVHFDGCLPGATEFEVIIYDDNAGFPGEVIAKSDSINLEEEILGDFLVRYWFDLAEPIPLDDAVTYWIEINTKGAPISGWFGGFDGGFGENNVQRNPTFEPDWVYRPTNLIFSLTGHPLDMVGGEFLPLDSTALLLAGAQTNAVWIMSALAVIGSIAFGALYITTKKN
jgi:hypothetical protein